MGRPTETWTRTGTAVDGNEILVLKDGDISSRPVIKVRAAAGQFRVFGSIDGTNYPSAPLVMSLEPAVDGSDNVTETQGTFVAASSGTRLHYIFGIYKRLKFVQKGTTPCELTVMASYA